jgi:hypothetical protein
MSAVATFLPPSAFRRPIRVDPPPVVEPWAGPLLPANQIGGRRVDAAPKFV